jgi:hypothetical protein
MKQEAGVEPSFDIVTPGERDTKSIATSRSLVVRVVRDLYAFIAGR